MSAIDEKWILNRKEMLELLKDMKITKKTDRLLVCKWWHQTQNIFAESINGWNQWLSNITLLEGMKSETLKEFFKSYKEYVMAFVELDIECTEMLEKEIGGNKDIVELIPKDATKKDVTPTYVA